MKPLATTSFTHALLAMAPLSLLATLLLTLALALSACNREPRTPEQQNHRYQTELLRCAKGSYGQASPIPLRKCNGHKECEETVWHLCREFANEYAPGNTLHTR